MPSRIVNELREVDQTRRDSEAITLDGESGNAAWRITEEFLDRMLEVTSVSDVRFNNQMV
jgi:hypothetical protein